MVSVGAHLDSTLSSSEENRFKKKHSVLISKLARKYRFTIEEMESLFIIYYKIQKCAPENSPAILKKQLREFLHVSFDITDEYSIDCICMVYCGSVGNYFALEDFIDLLGNLLHGTLTEKIKHCYKCYTVYNFDGLISRDSMFNALKNSVITSASDEDSEDVVRDLIDILQKKLDTNRGTRISFNDYKENVKNEPLLMECLGQCLPSRKAVHSFLTTFTKNRGKV